MKSATLFGAGTALVLVLATPAFAQPSANAEVEENTIIVTARRMEENLQDVPISISVFDQETLADHNISDALSLVNVSPSLSVNNRYGSENATFAIRGFFQETGTGPSVGVYFADVVAPRGFGVGIPSGDGAGPGSFFDLQNVQVLKGPQGTLFGRNTTGGAILLVPQKPTDSFEGYVEGSLGNYDMRRLQAVVNAPLSDSIRLRLGVDHMKRDGYVINDSGIGARDFFDVDYIAFRASLVADLTPDLENYTIFSLTDSDNNGTIQPISHCYEPVASSPAALFGHQPCDILAATRAKGFHHTTTDFDKNPTNKLKTWQAINTTTWHASDNLTVKNIISYARLKQKIDTPLYGTQFLFPLPPTFQEVTPVTYIDIRTVAGAHLSDQTTFTEELQFQGTALDGALTWQAGGYYEDSNPKSLTGMMPTIIASCNDSLTLDCFDVTVAFPPFFAPFGAVTSNRNKTWFSSKAVYAEATYELNDQFNVTGGIRYTWDKMRAYGEQRRWIYPQFLGSPLELCTLPGTTPPDCSISPSVKSNKPTWLIGVNYSPNDDVMIYAKYSRGYRTAGVKTDVPIEATAFGPEKVDTYEVGAKTTFSGAVPGTFNIAAFYNDFSNQQIQYGFTQNLDRRDAQGNPLPPIPVAPTAGPVNAGKSRIWGVEADAMIEPVDGLKLTASYVYLNAKVKELVSVALPSDSPYRATGDIENGDNLPFTPKHSLQLGANYTLPFDESVGDVSVGVTYSYTSEQIVTYATHTPALLAYFGRDIGVLQSRELVDASLNWRNIGGGPVDVGLFATNLTNAKYLTHLSNYTESLGFALGNLGVPRMYGARIKVSFGN